MSSSCSSRSLKHRHQAAPSSEVGSKRITKTEGSSIGTIDTKGVNKVHNKTTFVAAERSPPCTVRGISSPKTSKPHGHVEATSRFYMLAPGSVRAVRRVLEDGLGEGLSQKPGAGLVLLADPGQVSAEVDQELVVGLRDAGRLQDPLQLLSALLHTLTLCKTESDTTEHSLDPQRR
ncbi:hypothetical protein EYF80_015025 [Liparis tanakae]|uniref:Uncharacterized protein n=1 Tax=Liparis tanakae TaxID=230148 RepID=A0A4Z2I9T2_9TELE|nr:hypothetical protein EYF80_015025 [Liparis tanakae]